MQATPNGAPDVDVHGACGAVKETKVGDEYTKLGLQMLCVSQKGSG